MNYEFLKQNTMKKIVQTRLIASLMMATAIIFAGCSKDDDNSDDEKTSFHAASDKTWVIESKDGHIRQTWSDVIQTPKCNKADFDGGEWDATPKPKADCRSYTHEGTTYYYYSWPYVNANAAAMCPSPWRVPSKQDFIDLDVALGGSGEDRYAEPYWIEANYIVRWGGVYGGYAYGSTLVGVGHTGSVAYYWSSTEYDSSNAYDLCYHSFSVFPQLNNTKCEGLQIRCVK
jgi:uncharacterized protein (TIGR02145 family)